MLYSKSGRYFLGLWLLVTATGLVFGVWAGEANQAIAWRTLGLGGLASLIAIPLGAALAWVSLGSGMISRVVFATTICLLVVPVFLHVSCWDAALGRLGWLSVERGNVLVPMISGWSAAVWIHGVAAAPQVALLMILGITSGKQVYEEQLLLDTSRVEVFLHITLRRLWPLCFLSGLWIVVVCSREIAATDLYQIGTLAEQIYLGYSLGQWNNTAWEMPANGEPAGELPIGLTIGIILWLSSSAGWLVMRVTQLEWNSDQWIPWRTSAGLPSRRWWVGNWKSPRNWVGFCLLGVFVFVPLVNLVARSSFSIHQVNGQPVGTYTFPQFFSSLGRTIGNHTPELSWSCLIAASSATLIVVLAVFLAWKSARCGVGKLAHDGRLSARTRDRFWHFVFLASIVVACAVPGPLMGTLIGECFSRLGGDVSDWLYNRTILAPVMASAWYCWPLAPLVVWYVFRQIAVDAMEQAQLDGAGQGTRMIRFGVLGNLPALAGCWLISFAFCFGELSASQLVLPPGIDTIPRLMLGLLHAGVDELTSALTLIMLALMLALSALGWCCIRLNQTRMNSK